MHSTIMNFPLTIPHILQRAERYFPDREVVSLIPAGVNEAGQPIPGKHKYTYRQMAARARQLANALKEAGIQKGDRVATFAVNHFRHLEAYFGIPIAGAVLHTVNVRLHPEQLVYIINHAQDRILLIDNVFARMLPALLPHCPSIEKVVIMGPTPQSIPGMLDYDQWIGAQPTTFDFPELDENDPAGMCYTSGTTGHPKGVVYSHRSTVLHSLASALPDALNLKHADSLLPVVPMFHVNAWGLPYTATMVGAKQVFASVFSDGASLAKLLSEEQCTRTAGVPTIWMGLLQEVERAIQAGTPYDLSKLEMLVVGGSAAPESLIRAGDKLGLHLFHAWGMTETHPLGTCASVPVGVDVESDEGYHYRAKQGIPVPLVEIRAVDGDLNEVPHDGKTMGALLVRGAWVSQEYYNNPEGSRATQVRLDDQVWFDTGDIITIDEEGYMAIQDRAKDLIKSGGEWISSVDLENALMGHPAIAEAAVIATPHPRWEERPLGVLVVKPGQEQPSREDLNAFLAEKFAKWWLPDAYVFVEQIPRTTVGKFLKRALRDQFKDFRLEQ
ncbi:long-chain fatty acid--CoA ligase [Deinococcus cellulosilyticus]|uniref:Long-chain-fatty-acid--CoA ligase n=1 Tax=Deinococcus cellulosilyticus (strain DSM 18568 / NBRC 106333 / KACC 11606 / 5516J-15) TaxID=1223518 RepID=A0A511N9L2_DEIC1|nr:long-chain fatty acid--CoA ligase [Deinococcus cellulosilyticus]GEM49480.1 long-chain-fatty-acid--CoA ligase [Deinococcus cellulosilyticus NBRC 106333 = KACC 11606]